MPNTQPPAGSQAEQDVKNNKIFEWIAILGFIVLHTVCFAVSKARFVEAGKHPWHYIVPVAAVTWLVICIKDVINGVPFFQESKIPYIGLIILAFVSCWALFYCPAC